MTIIIRDHETNAINIIGVPEGTNASQYVEQWQKKSIRYAVRGTLPPVSWKIADGEGIVECMVESVRI